jgi:hypothetical protein
MNIRRTGGRAHPHTLSQEEARRRLHAGRQGRPLKPESPSRPEIRAEMIPTDAHPQGLRTQKGRLRGGMPPYIPPRT